MDDCEAAESETAPLTSGRETAPPPSSSPSPASLRFALLVVAPLILVSVGLAVLHNVFFWDSESSASPVWKSSSVEQGGLSVHVVPPPVSSADIVSEVKQHELTNVGTNSHSTVPNSNVEPQDKNIVEIASINYTKLERLEAGLQMARRAILDVQSGNQTDLADDKDYVPSGPVYRNAKTFHRSYLEMEKQFKIYIYDEGERQVFHNGPCQGILAIEGYFINQMEMGNRFVTKDQEEAHLFFLPFSITYLIQFVYVVDSHQWGPMRNTIKDYVRVISEKYPYWNRSLGADHFVLACHDWGPEISFSVPHLYKNSIRALCNANTSERFIPSKDVSIPEIPIPYQDNVKSLLGGPPPSKRDILAFFAGGGDHGPIRPILLKHWENKDKDMEVHQYLPKGVDYYQMMRRAKFCLCPSGYEVASPRAVESLYTGCVPVLLKSGYTRPFSDVLNWDAFSISVPIEDIPNLKNILTSISQRRYLSLQRRGVQMRKHFVINYPPKRYDAFHMILHSLWLRRLNIHINDAQQTM
ncbi:unnamed protein product [Rhodiola kirilowii]